jgi:hypothetical protein
MTSDQANESYSDQGKERTKKEAGKLNVLAIQLAMEEEQLLEWREKRHTINFREI